MARKAAAKSTRPSRSPGFRDVGVGSRDFPAAMTELLEQQHLQNYRGWSFAIARRVKTLNQNHRSSEDYMKSLFIRGVILGASYEWERCGGSATNCDDGLRSRGAFTPFFELKVHRRRNFGTAWSSKDEVQLPRVHQDWPR